ncbi:hypothetical protein Moror_3420 [Moniliophthora roreri MCA 2997]|uniref:Uncharacterized protein n=1 Tax=Moniliophthora roreri (strain MCA 2997) TaxID=1381753 RepID=V2WJ76_MONRO|nr:hypothetical protein Moror_3420 [Moniliophthora roreri MCA 2997]
MGVTVTRETSRDSAPYPIDWRESRLFDLRLVQYHHPVSSRLIILWQTGSTERKPVKIAISYTGKLYAQSTTSPRRHERQGLRMGF